MTNWENDYQTDLFWISLDFLPELPSVSEQEESFLLLIMHFLGTNLSLLLLISSIF